MTVREFMDQWEAKHGGETGYFAHWAADTMGGFGKKGWSAYGDINRCEVIAVVLQKYWEDNTVVVPDLQVWMPIWGEFSEEEWCDPSWNLPEEVL